MDTKALTRDVLALILAIGAIVSFFIPTAEAVQRVAISYLSLVVGFYFGAGTAPILGARK